MWLNLYTLFFNNSSLFSPTFNHTLADGTLKFAVDEGQSGGKVPQHGRRSDSATDAAVERVKAGLLKDFGPDVVRSVRRVEPNLRDAATAEILGITPEARAAFEQTFGVKLAFLLADRKLPFNGLRSSVAPGVLFLDVRNRSSALAIASHELMHEISGTRPDLYHALDSFLTPLLKDFPKFKERLDGLYERVKLEKLTEREAREELYADFLSEQMGEPQFWKHLQRVDAGLFTRLADAIGSFLDKILWRLRDFEGTRWFTDLERARGIMANAVADFARGRERIDADGGRTKFSIHEGTPRATGEKIQTSDRISDEVKAAITQYLYEPRGNRTDTALAQGILERVGIDDAFKLWRENPPELPGAVRSQLLGAITRDLAAQERQLRSTDPAAAQALANKQAAIWDEALPQITDMAQSLQAMRDMVDMSPDAHVARVRREMDRAGTKEIETRRGEIDQVRQAVEEGRRNGAAAVRMDEEANTAARAAVDEAIIESPETRRAIIMDLAEVFSQVPYIVQHAREAVRAKADQLLNRQPRPAGLSPAQHLRQIMDDLGRRAADIFAAHMQGAEPGVSIVRKFQDRLGLDDATARKLATTLSQGLEAEIAKAQKKLADKIARQREQQRRKVERAEQTAKAGAERSADQILGEFARSQSDTLGWGKQGAPDPVRAAVKEQLDTRALTDEQFAAKLEVLKVEPATASALSKAVRREMEIRDTNQLNQPDSKLDSAIRRQLREHNLKLGEVLRQEAGRRGETGEHIADRVVKASGLTGSKAETFRNILRRRWDALVADGQRRALEAIQKRSGVKVTGKVRTAFDRIVELDRLGALNDTQFFGVVKDALKLKRLTDADAKQLRGLVQAAHDAPEGWQKQRAIARVLTFQEHLKGEMGWKDVPMAVWYANVFSSPATHAANVIGNTFKAMEVLGIEILKRPIAAPQILRAFARGAEKGGLEAANVLRTGQVEGTRLLKAEAARPLEWRVQQGGWNKVFTPWAMVGRLLAAEDVLPFKAHEEIRWMLQARRVAKSEGLIGEALDKRVNELLHNTDAAWQAAKAQAATEGLKGMDLQRRAHELIEQQREASMPGSTELARNYGLEHTFNAEPYGVAGAIAEVLNYANQKLVVTRFAVPVVRIVANLTNESLNYFPPVGIARLVIASKTRRLNGKAIASAEEVHYSVARAAVGTALFGALTIAGAKSLEDPDPAFAISGQGPRTRNQREQLRSTGWKPNSIKIGDRYYSYQESHLAIPLNILGNYFDAIRYRNLSEEDAATRSAYVLQNSIHTILDQRMLSGVADLMDAMSNESASGSGKELTRFLSRPAASFLVPNAARWIDQVFDPAVYDADDVKGLVYQQIPVARRQNRAALNVFGEPIERGALERFTTPAKPDLLMTVIASRNAWVPLPGIDGMVVGDRQRGPDYFRPITPEEYYQFVAETGPKIREALTKDMDKIAGMEPAQAQAHVRRLANRIHSEELKQFRP